MAISLVVPFLKIPVYFNLNDNSSALLKTAVYYNNLLLPEVVVTTTNNSPFLNWQPLLVVVYIIVVLLLLFRIIIAVKNLVSARFRFPAENWDHVLFINTAIADAPFSFFRWIFWNRKINIQSEEGQKILRHELYHVGQMHSVDILFSEICCSLFWINPFFHFIKNEIKATHEFLADDYAADTDDKLKYAKLLVIQAITANKISLATPFFNNQLKRRIQMLTFNQKTSYQYLRKIMVLPLLAVIGLLFIISCKTKEAEPKPVEQADTVLVKKDTVKIAETEIGEVVKPNPEPIIFSKVEIDAAYPGGPMSWRNYLQKNLRAAVALDNGAAPGTYTAIIQFIVEKEGSVSNIKPLTSIGYGMEAEAIRVIKKSGKWKPAIQNGQEVKAYRKQPITFQIIKG